jgi:hypothetical protein
MLASIGRCKDDVMSRWESVSKLLDPLANDTVCISLEVCVKRLSLSPKLPLIGRGAKSLSN